MGTAIKHPVPNRSEPSFVIFDIRALWRSALSVRVSGRQKLQMTAQPGLAQDALWLYPYGNSGYHRVNSLIRFYRAMHFSAKRGIAIACRLSVRPFVCLSVTLVNCDHIGWSSSKIISPLVSLGRSLFATPTRRVCSKGNTPKFSPE